MEMEALQQSTEGTDMASLSEIQTSINKQMLTDNFSVLPSFDLLKKHSYLSMTSI
jgi:hypothetical protein